MKVEEQWVETIAVLLLVSGFIISVLLKNPMVSYASVFLSGFIAGRIYYFKKQKEPIFPFILIISGFLVGYLIGNFWVSRTLTIIFFAIGFGLSYYLHVKKIFVIFKNENFVK
jgi:hypothetical protein